jgi:hypothetical protein
VASGALSKFNVIDLLKSRRRSIQQDPTLTFRDIAECVSKVVSDKFEDGSQFASQQLEKRARPPSIPGTEQLIVVVN